MEKPKAERVAKILELMDNEYGLEYRCYLNHENAWQLLIAVILSAQCTDARVNYNDPSIVVDTHVKRISKRFGFTQSNDPEKIEYDLMEVLPKDHWILYNIHIITLGRTICTARNPKCSECFLKQYCSWENKK